MTGLLRTVVTGRNTRPVARERADPPWTLRSPEYTMLSSSLEKLEKLARFYVRSRKQWVGRATFDHLDGIHVHVPCVSWRVRASSYAAKTLSCRYYREYLRYSVANTRIHASETSPGKKTYNIHRPRELSRVYQSSSFFLLCR